MTHTATRDRLIQAGAELFAEHGYNATGINTVLKATGIPKGSFYHYFSSKEDFGLAVIDSFAEAFDAELASTLRDTSVPPLERLRRYFTSIKDEVASHECSRGCLIGNLGQELSSKSDVFRSRLNYVFQGWERNFVVCLADARAAGEIDAYLDPEALSSFILVGWEGAILRAKMVRSVQPMEAFEAVLFERILAPQEAAI